VCRVEAVSPIRCDLDTVHCTYDPDAVSRFWHVLGIADMPRKRFSTNFYDKISPVHFFWGSFDLAVTRFTGPRAPARAGADAIQAEAYSHEVISAGFWPGNGGYGQAAFYAYATPEGLEQTAWNTGRFDPVLREFILDYDDARPAPRSNRHGARVSAGHLFIGSGRRAVGSHESGPNRRHLSSGTLKEPAIAGEPT
jgi:hypothetical protein